MKRFICAVISAIILLYTAPVLAGSDGSVEDFYAEVLSEEGKAVGEEYITRSEFVSVLMKSMGYTKDLYICSFYDIYDADWDYVYIANAERKGIALGNPDGGFTPYGLLTVQEAVAFVSRAYKVNPYFGDNTEKNIMSFICPEYAADYIKYAIANGAYPKAEKGLLQPDGLIPTKQALELIADYGSRDNFSQSYIGFLPGYPKITETGNSTSIGILIKTNKPCRIYSRVMLSDKTSSAYLPERDKVSDFLTSVSAADTEIKITIPAEQQQSYNIFLTAVDENGAVSRVYPLKNVTPLPFTIGDGSRANPYRIYTKYQLDHVRNYADKCFLLCNDIEYNDRWEPIGSSLEQSEMFSGVFDGGGHSITGLKINGGNYVGMFAVLYGGTVKSLNLHADVKGTAYVGVIAGESRGGTIESCHTAGFCEASENLAGGIVGRNNGVIKNSVSALYTVTSAAYSGGIAGSSSGSITDCISAVTSVYADMYSSSVAGINTGGLIGGCVGASIEVTDTLTKNSGRITTNREQGRCENNYVYDGMLSGDNIYRDKDGQDGEEISWDTMLSQQFYEKELKWNFRDLWGFKKSFLLPCMKNTQEPVLQLGITIYAPLGISSEAELANIKNNLNAHYYLKNDITLTPGSSWTPIGLTKGDGDYENGFRGTLDGRGHTISKLKVDYDENILQYGLFGTLYGGTVRNLILADVSVEGHSYVGAVAGVNYGTISSCRVSGSLRAYQYDRETLAGGICAMNYTNIYSSQSSANIAINAVSATAGGITAQNEGFIHGCSYNARLSAQSRKKSANAILGGICGINYSGMIYNCFGGNSISSAQDTSYCGGIVGMMNGGEIYKCSSLGGISSVPVNSMPSYAYVGGICGMMSGGLVMNSFTQCNESVRADISYAGGICGYGEGFSIQNVYSLNTINQRGNPQAENAQIYAGGICGYNSDGSISGTAAINPYIVTNGSVGEICAFTEGGYVDNNYYADSLYINGARGENAEAGIPLPLKTLENNDFFITPAEKGGLLGWLGESEGENVWISSSRSAYPFPVLSGVENQALFTLPAELKKVK